MNDIICPNCKRIAGAVDAGGKREGKRGQAGLVG